MKANQTEGKRHSWKERGKKILSPALLCLCAVMLLVWAVQLLFFEDAYRFIKSWKLEAVMEEVSRNLSKEQLPQIAEELRMDHIDIRVIDAQGKDWAHVNQESGCILAGYTQQELAEFYRQARAYGETNVKQVIADSARKPIIWRPAPRWSSFRRRNPAWCSSVRQSPLRSSALRSSIHSCGHSLSRCYWRESLPCFSAVASPAEIFGRCSNV